jgi:hypothetical protein
VIRKFNQSDSFYSVNRVRLVKTENPSARVTVNVNRVNQR